MFCCGIWCLANFTVSQIPQCVRQISHNAPFCDRNVHTSTHFFYKFGALWDICLIHCGICEVGLCSGNIRGHFPELWEYLLSSHIIHGHTLQWRHNEHDGVSNHQRQGCLLNRLFRRRSKKTSNLRITGPLCGKFTGDRWIPHTKGQ